MRVVVLALVCIACGGGQKAQPPLSATWSAPSMLSKVPADSPYLMAVLDPMPDLVRRQTFKALDEQLTTALAELEAAEAAGTELTLQHRWLIALRDELEGKDMHNWGRELGFDPGGRFVIYGLSVWPVLRVAIADAGRMRQVLANVIRKSNTPAVEHTLAGRTYWQAGDKDIAFVASVLDHELVVTMMPARALPQFLPIVFGMQRPPHTLHEDNRLAALLGRYKLLPTLVGYLDLQIAADILTQRAASSATELDRPLRTAMGPVDQACKTDIDRLVAVAPRAVFGYRRYDRTGMHARVIVEMPPAHAAALQRLRVPMPELTAGLGERVLARFGVAIKLDELLPLLRRVTDHVGAQPFTCSWFAPLNSAAEQLGQQLAKPVPPALFGFRGISAVLDSFTQQPMSVEGHALIVADHASDIVNLLLRFVPGASSVALQPDARPVQLPLTALGVPASISAYAATRVDRAAIAVGPDSANDVGAALNTPAPAASPLISVGFDMQRMIELELVKRDQDSSRLRDVVLQLEARPEGLVVEMYATFPDH